MLDMSGIAKVIWMTDTHIRNSKKKLIKGTDAPASMKRNSPIKYKIKKVSPVSYEHTAELQVKELQKALKTKTIDEHWERFNEDHEDLMYAWYMFESVKDGCTFAVMYHKENNKVVFTLYGLNENMSYNVDITSVKLNKEDADEATIEFTNDKCNGRYTHTFKKDIKND